MGAIDEFHFGKIEDGYTATLTKNIISNAKYLEIPIKDRKIFINDRQVSPIDFFGNENYYNKDLLRPILPIGSSVLVDEKKEKYYLPDKRIYHTIGTILDIDFLTGTITIDFLRDDHYSKEIESIINELSNESFRYYAVLKLYVKLDGLKLVINEEKENAVYLDRIGYDEDNYRLEKGKIEETSVMFDSNNIVFKDYTTGKIFNNIDDYDTYNHIVDDLDAIHKNTRISLTIKGLEDANEYIGKINREFRLPRNHYDMMYIGIDCEKQDEVFKILSVIRRNRFRGKLIVPIKKYRDSNDYIIDNDQDLYIGFKISK